jgi:hypothetical protein
MPAVEGKVFWPRRGGRGLILLPLPERLGGDGKLGHSSEGRKRADDGRHGSLVGRGGGGGGGRLNCHWLAELEQLGQSLFLLGTGSVQFDLGALGSFCGRSTRPAHFAGAKERFIFVRAHGA